MNLHTARKDRLAVPQVSWNHFPPGNSQHRSLVLEAIGWVGHDLATEQEEQKKAQQEREGWWSEAES